MNNEQEVMKLKAMLEDMESDFLQCAQGKSPCFFCANDETCECTNDKDCNFKWQPHN